jgi:hypothetical protein
MRRWWGMREGRRRIPPPEYRTAWSMVAVAAAGGGDGGGRGLEMKMGFSLGLAQNQIQFRGGNKDGLSLLGFATQCPGTIWSYGVPHPKIERGTRNRICPSQNRKFSPPSHAHTSYFQKNQTTERESGPVT